MKKIFLKTPSFEDINYRILWTKDKETMAYNMGLDIDIKGYDKNTGTINYSDEEIKEWYQKWINKEPDRYYAYIYADEVEPVGEIYYYHDGNIHSIGIMIYNRYRGKGYSLPAILELEKIAFEKNNINALNDMIPINREKAIKLFEQAGFVQTDKQIIEKVFDKEIVVKELLITKDMYFTRKGGIYE